MEDKTIILDVTFKAALLERWQRLELNCEACGVSVRFDLQRLRDRTKHRVVSEFVSRAHCRFCGSPPTGAYLVKRFAENDPLRHMAFHVEEWSDDGIRRQALLSACHSAGAGRAAFELTAKERPKQFITLRKGTWLLATTRPDPSPDKVIRLPDRKQSGAEPDRADVPRLSRAHE